MKILHHVKIPLTDSIKPRRNKIIYINNNKVIKNLNLRMIINI